MAEDSWLRCEREYFASISAQKYEIAEKKINKILEGYNLFLQKALIGESPFVAEDLRLTILSSGGKSDTEQQDREPRKPDSKA